MRFLLWDRLLQRELVAARKEILVNKTPNDVFIADRIARCWPDAPGSTRSGTPERSRARARKARRQDTPERNASVVLRYGNAIQQARADQPGVTIRYEELTADPRDATKRLCAFLGVQWEAGMLEYGRFDHGRMRRGSAMEGENQVGRGAGGRAAAAA